MEENTGNLTMVQKPLIVVVGITVAVLIVRETDYTTEKNLKKN